MDPLSALSLAGTIIQFADFGAKVLGEGYAIYTKGGSSIFDDVETIVNDLNDFVAKFQSSLNNAPSSKTSTENDIAIEQLCSRCSTIATELIHRFEGIKALRGQGVKKKKLRSMQAALILVWSRKDIEETGATLESYRAAIQTRLLYGLKQDFDVSLLRGLRRFDSLDQQLQHVFQGVLDTQNAAERDRSIQRHAVARLLSLTEVVIQNQKNSDQRTIVNALGGYEQTEESSTFQILKEQKDKISSIAHSITTSLSFPTITERIDTVDKAHEKTYRWIFEEDDTEDNFVRWLRGSDGVYWINGKAGSGKSTLMKYIFQNPKTTECLSHWTKDSDVSTILSGFFFWAGGTLQQRSQEGLLRALLFDIISQHPDLVPVVFPTQWALLYEGNIEMDQIREWTLPSLLKAFKTLQSQQTVPLKICLFIDGLDEYDGDHANLAQLFEEFSETTFIKICAASRPLAVFQRAFKNKPSFRLQDLTRPDIEKYVHDVFIGNEDIRALLKGQPRETEGLKTEIVNAADGVFLWVVLVVKRLLKGAMDGDRLSELQIHLKSLPPELDNLFELMVLKVDKIYYDQASRIFQIVEANVQQGMDWIGMLPLNLVSLAMADEEVEESQLNSDGHVWTEEQILFKCKTMAARLKSRCGDLIEVQSTTSITSSSTMQDAKITFLHRTVRDFLIQPRIKTILTERTSETYDPEVALIRSDVLQLKFEPDRTGLLLRDAFVYAWRLQQKSKQIPELLLDQLCKFPTQHPEAFHIAASCGNNVHYTVLHLPIFFGIHTYFIDKLRRRKDFEYEQLVCMFDWAFDVFLNYLGISGTRRRFSPPVLSFIIPILSTLLSSRVDPNAGWKKLLHDLNKPIIINDATNNIYWTAETVKLFLKHGVNPFLHLERDRLSATQILRNFFGEDSEYDREDGIKSALIRAKLKYSVKQSLCLQQ